MTTIRQISNITGFSISTVSKALNDGMDISIETKKYIQKIALQKNYIPNKAAISLRKRRSNSIAIILPQANQLVYGEVLFIIQKLAIRYKYRIVLFQSFGNFDKEMEYLKEVNDGSFDGVLLVSGKLKENEIQSNIPVSLLKGVNCYDLEDLRNTCITNFNQLLKQIE